MDNYIGSYHFLVNYSVRYLMNCSPRLFVKGKSIDTTGWGDGKYYFRNKCCLCRVKSDVQFNVRTIAIAGAVQSILRSAVPYNGPVSDAQVYRMAIGVPVSEDIGYYTESADGLLQLYPVGSEKPVFNAYDLGLTSMPNATIRMTYNYDLAYNPRELREFMKNHFSMGADLKIFVKFKEDLGTKFDFTKEGYYDEHFEQEEMVVHLV